MSTITTNAATNLFVSPFIAALTATANKTVDFEIIQVETVSIADINETFSVTLSDADAVKILNAFSVADPDLSDGTDATANAEVGFTNTADFRSAVQGALVDSLSDTSVDISGYLFGAGVGDVDARLNAEIKSAFFRDSFPNILATFSRNALTLSVDNSGAANNMGEAIANGSEDVRRYFLTQLPTGRVSAYQLDGSADVVENLSFLPLLKGDKLVMVWNATVNLSATAGDTTQRDATGALTSPVSDTTADRVVAGGAPVIVPTYAALASVSRRIAVQMTLGSGSVPFAVDNATGKLTA